MGGIKTKNKIALTFFAISIVLIVYVLKAYFNNQNGKTGYLGHLDDADHIFDSAQFERYIEDIEKFDVLVLFVISSEFCASCINEIVEYSEATTEYIHSSLNPYLVNQHSFTIGKDSTDYKRVNKIFNFPFSSTLLKKNSPMAEFFSELTRDKTGLNQIVVIDIRGQKIVGRIGIFTSSTSPHFKKNLVQEVFYELER